MVILIFAFFAYILYVKKYKGDVMKNILVLEDSYNHEQIIKEVLGNINNVKIYIAKDAATAFKISMENNINVFILEIALKKDGINEMSGYDFAEKIRGVDEYKFSPIIVVTWIEDPMNNVLHGVHCYEYLEKPIDKNILNSVVKKALKFPQLKEKEKYIKFRWDGIFYRVNVEDVIYIENIRRKMILYTEDEELIIPYTTEKELMKKLDSDLFVKCNRTTSVNKHYFKNFDPTNRFLKLKGIDDDIEVSKSKVSNIRKVFCG